MVNLEILLPRLEIPSSVNYLGVTPIFEISKTKEDFSNA
jgi:hypothetical protein